MSENDTRETRLAAAGEALRKSGYSLAVAESLTGGLLCNSFARMEGASEFFLGGVVAYSSSVKFEALGVTPGPVVSRRAADEMAAGVENLLHSDLAIAVTGAGGPDPQDGQAPGSVFITLRLGGSVRERQELRISGSPEDVCIRTCEECLAMVTAVVAS